MSTFEPPLGDDIGQKRTYSQKAGDFWQKHGEKTVLLVGIALIALISFEAGYLKGRKNEKRPVEVNQAACAPCPKAEESAGSGEKAQPSGNAKTEKQPSIENQKCAFVASKNSNKYHLPTCQFAQKIKPENKACFSSAEEAESRGYQAAKCCIK